jgi:predicted MFS family arabinose efflux permease
MIPFSYLVLYASKVLGLDATGYGLLLSFSAVGGLAGSWVAGRVRRRLGYGWSIVGALLLGAAAFVVIALTDNVIVVAIALAAYICHSVVWGVLASSVRQRITPDEIMGRVGSMSRLLGLLGLGLGAFLGGVLASVLGLRVPFVVAAGLFVIAAALCVTLVPRLRAWERAQAESVEGVVEAAEER